MVWSSSKYEYTHQKTLVVDGSEAVIMTANLTSQYYATSRDFLVTDTSQADVERDRRRLQRRLTHITASPPATARTWSGRPPTPRTSCSALINGAQHSLRIYSEEMGDSTIEKALIAAANRGVDVQVCGENTGGEYDSDFAKLTEGGVHVSYYSDEDGFYIHGKVIEADYGARRGQGVHRIGELLQHLAQPEPRARPDHLQRHGNDLDRQRLQHRLRPRPKVSVTSHPVGRV